VKTPRACVNRLIRRRIFKRHLIQKKLGIEGEGQRGSTCERRWAEFGPTKVTDRGNQQVGTKNLGAIVPRLKRGGWVAQRSQHKISTGGEDRKFKKQNEHALR